MGQPLGDASAVAFSLGCAAVREHAPVVYSGEGIDEFFGGYNAHKRELPSDWTYLTCSHIMSEEVVQTLMKDFDTSVRAVDPVAALWKEVEGQDPLAQKLTIDISLWLEGDIYLNTDRTSTACGVELHTPFSDLRLFNVARRIPSSYQFDGEQNKVVFRMAAESKLPHEVAFRKKVGFPVPVRKWLSDERYNKPVEAALFGEASQKLFNQDAVHDLWTRFIGGESLLWNRVYAVYVFLIWYEMNF
jgi:asparagine synthase (glutamine-hydrolysing)